MPKDVLPQDTPLKFDTVCLLIKQVVVSLMKHVDRAIVLTYVVYNGGCRITIPFDQPTPNTTYVSYITCTMP